MASHGRIPGLVTQDRPRAVREPCRGHRRPVYPHVYGVDAGVSGTARRKPARPLRSRHRFLLRHSLCKADTASGRVSLAGQRTDRPGSDVPGSEPSQPNPEPVMAGPFPVMSLPSHSASRAPRSQTRPAAQPLYLYIAAVRGNARSCRGEENVRITKRIADLRSDGVRTRSWARRRTLARCWPLGRRCHHATAAACTRWLAVGGRCRGGCAAPSRATEGGVAVTGRAGQLR